MPVITSPSNLLQAWRSIRGNIPKYRRENCRGPDGVTMAEYERDLQCQLSILRYQLLKGKYQPKQPVYFSLPKTAGGKRKIAVLAISDRVAQRAVMQIIEPYWERVFLSCSFGYRPGLSIQHAKKHVNRLRSTGNAWVVNGDIDGFFDNLDQNILLRNFQKRIKDCRVIELLSLWLQTGVMNAHPVNPEEITTRVSKSSEPVFSWINRRLHPIISKELFDHAGLSQNFQPYDEKLFNFSDDAGHYPTEQIQLLLKQTLHQAAAGGLMAAGSLVKPLVFQSFSAFGNILTSAQARKLISRILFSTGCAVAAGTAVAGYFLSYKSQPSGKGVLQGSPLSPLLANIYLHPFDQTLSRKGFSLVRYADDWLLLTSTEEQALRAYNEAIRCLVGLRLKINQEKTRIVSPDETLSWLGSQIPARSMQLDL
jgi:RNA-directed DNA polymerase